MSSTSWWWFCSLCRNLYWCRMLCSVTDLLREKLKLRVNLCSYQHLSWTIWIQYDVRVGCESHLVRIPIPGNFINVFALKLRKSCKDVATIGCAIVFNSSLIPCHTCLSVYTVCTHLSAMWPKYQIFGPHTAPYYFWNQSLCRRNVEL